MQSNKSDADFSESAVEFKHYPVLDGLRGVAVLIVMLYHLELLVPELNMFVRGGFLGVDVFFVLSGFLITSVLMKEYSRTGKISLKNFYWRRFLRLAPAFWVFLLVMYIFGNTILPPREAAVIYENDNFLYSFFYAMNWHRAFGFGATGNLNHTWSLAIEEQFYIVWSLFLVGAYFFCRNRKQIFLLTLATVLGLTFLRSFRAISGTETTILYYSTESRIDAILIGCGAAMIFGWRLIDREFFRSKNFGRAAVFAGALSMAIIFSFSHEDRLLYAGAMTVFSISVSLVILWLITNEESYLSRVFAFTPLRLAGQISYALYLWHYAFFEFGKKYFSSGFLQVSVGISLAFAVSVMSYFLIEKPFLQMKSKFSDH